MFFLLCLSLVDCKSTHDGIKVTLRFQTFGAMTCIQHIQNSRYDLEPATDLAFDS